jgi:hypothetical protein
VGQVSGLKNVEWKQWKNVPGSYRVKMILNLFVTLHFMFCFFQD